MAMNELYDKVMSILHDYEEEQKALEREKKEAIRKENTTKERAKREKERKQQYLNYKKVCAKCGESRSWLIQFHHINPSEKEFNIGTAFSVGGNMKRIENEIKKCVCLCSNCHDEYHYFYGKRPSNPVESLQEYLSDDWNYNDLINE